MDYREIFDTALPPVLILVGAFAVSRLLSWFLTRFERNYLEHDEDEAARVARLQRGIVDPADRARSLRQKRALTMATLLRAAGMVLIWTIAVILALESLGLPVTPLLAAAGIGGLAIGFGAKSLVEDLISGFFILLERQFDVGDTIAVGDVKGTVERLELRSTVLRDIDGRRHVVPNGEIRVSTNYTHTFSRYALSIPVPYEADVDRVCELAADVAERMRAGSHAGLITEPVNVLGVDDYGDSAVEVRLYLETVPGRQWEVGREFRRRLKLALDEAGISMPYPHREVILREADSGTAA